MNDTSFYYKSNNGIEIYARKWMPEDAKPKAFVQIAHGMGEHIGRYHDFAQALIEKGYAVYGNDHRGHGLTAKDERDKRYFADENGFGEVVQDMYALTNLIKCKQENIPIFLFGHSMGSFLSRRYIQLYGNQLHGVILSGTGQVPSLLGEAGRMAAKMEMKLKGKRTPSPLLDRLSFGQYNRPFRPNRTDFDWLSRDEQAVDRYINDPLCGGIFSSGFFYDLLSGIKQAGMNNLIQQVPSDLPIFLVSGDEDPVGGHTKGVLKTYTGLKEAGIKDVTYKFYPKGRHEMLHEINRDEVIEDIINWLENHVSS
ncbi:alpha/beta hydrolase [Priestia abyssalis]|uniref:alpha/beta hydrolase n=1 Tax=Priestia abyssalis TaxID=1221450 RepID=UPI000994C2F3|nr:alpha/beta hydrolase [Priestia abyssalis]